METRSYWNSDRSCTFYALNSSRLYCRYSSKGSRRQAGLLPWLDAQHRRYFIARDEHKVSISIELLTCLKTDFAISKFTRKLSLSAFSPPLLMIHTKSSMLSLSYVLTVHFLQRFRAHSVILAARSTSRNLRRYPRSRYSGDAI